MTKRMLGLKAAHAASRTAGTELHALYEQDTSNKTVWEMFQAQVKQTVALHAMITEEIITPTPDK